jgi:hypothetical protein
MGDDNPNNRRRSQRVLLQVPITFWMVGARGDRLQVQGFTLVVNAHGGLFEAPHCLVANQKITLINASTGKLAECRVVRCNGPRDACYSIAFEFDHPNPKFWPISFPPVDWEDTASMTKDDC